MTKVATPEVPQTLAVSQEELAKIVGEEMAKALKDMDHAAVKALSDEEKAKLKALGGDSKADEAAKEIVGKFLSALGSGDETVLRDLSEGTDADGGYIVPTEFRKQLIEKLYTTPRIRKFATVIPMGSDKMDLPVEGNGVSVNWTPELTTIVQSDPTFAMVTLAVNLLAGISRQSRQLLADAAINQGVQDLIIRLFARAIGFAEDRAFMVGTGSGQPKGIRTETYVSVAQVGANLADTDLDKLWYALPEQYRSRAVWIMPDTVRGKISAFRSTDGRKLYGTELDSTDAPVLRGKPVVISPDIPTNLGGGTNESEIYLGAVEYYYIGDREQVFAETSTQEGQSFEKHRAAVKVGTRLDGKMTITECMVKMTGVK